VARRRGRKEGKMAMRQAAHPQPSQRARDLVRGAYDLHVHSGPDVVKRRIDDIDLAKRCAEVGLAGYLIKSHYVPTSARAALTRQAVPGVNVLGSVTLNALAGGMNPLTIEIAAREGARLVWFPTVDAVNERTRIGSVPREKLPFWARLQQELREQGVEAEPGAVVHAEGNLLPAVRQVIRKSAQHQLMLATGHLGRDEIFAVVNAAVEEGVK